MDKTKVNLERLRAHDAEWEESAHPRAKNGQFTSGGGSAGGETEQRPVNPDYIKMLKSKYQTHKESIWNEKNTAKPDSDYLASLKKKLDDIIDEYKEITGNDISSDIKKEKSKSESPKSPLRQAAEAIKGGSGEFDVSPEKKQSVLNVLHNDVDMFGSRSPVGEISASVLEDLQNGKSFMKAINNAKKKFKGQSDEHDSHLYNLYTMGKGPQGNKNFSSDYKGNDYRSRKKALEAEAENWLES